MMRQLSRRLDVPMSEVVRIGLSMLWFMAAEVDNGNRVMVDRQGALVEVALLNLERGELSGVDGEIVPTLEPLEWGPQSEN
jgi:hypothetical protein